MKIITNTYYQATDGTAFDTQKDCEEYEDYINSEAKLTKLAYLVNTKMSFPLVSSFIYNNYDKIKEIMEGKAEDVYTVSTEVNWSKVPAGTMILVRDYPDENWIERKFLYWDGYGRFACCNTYDPKAVTYWSLAELKS